MTAPVTMTSAHTGSLPLVSSVTGSANIATPTPNQPIWVMLMMAEGKNEPFSPNERCASRSSERPVFWPM